MNDDTIPTVQDALPKARIVEINQRKSISTLVIRVNIKARDHAISLDLHGVSATGVMSGSGKGVESDS